MYFYGYGYNLTWWFMSLILGLYLLFPVIKYITSKNNIILVAILFLLQIQFLGIITDIKYILGVLLVYLLPFAIGIGLSLSVNDRHLLIFNKYKIFVLVLSVIFSIAYIILYYLDFTLFNVKIFHASFVFALALIVIARSLFDYVAILKYILQQYGLVSYEIFLSHTFIYYYYLQDIIYYFHNPVVIFVIMTILCLITGILVHKLTSTLMNGPIDRLNNLWKNTSRKMI